jgi:hypothetical protein
VATCAAKSLLPKASLTNPELKGGQALGRLATFLRWAAAVLTVVRVAVSGPVIQVRPKVRQKALPDQATVLYRYIARQCDCRPGRRQPTADERGEREVMRSPTGVRPGSSLGRTMMTQERTGQPAATSVGDPTPQTTSQTQTTGNRCATRRPPRSPPTVDSEVKCSLRVQLSIPRC